MGIAAIILAKNEEKNIAKALQSVRFCDEVIVIDDVSKDETKKIAMHHGANVITHPLRNDFASQRNFALQQTQQDWILFLDADEVISEALQKEILVEVQNNIYDGFFLKRHDVLFGKKLLHGEAGNIQLIRLAKRNAGTWKGKVHEVWNIKGKIGRLQQPLLHYPHPTIPLFLAEINFYSTLRAQELYELQVHTSWLEIIAYPKAKFVVNYFLKLGFLDGIPGLLLALFMSFHSFLVRGKLWLLWQKK